MQGKHDWIEIYQKILDAIDEGLEINYTSLSKYINVPRSTLIEYLRDNQGIRNSSDLIEFVEERRGNIQSLTSETVIDIDNKEISSIPSSRITTLEQLLNICQVDLLIWTVDHYIVNKWEVGAKTAKKRLSFTDGVITSGEIDDSGKLTVEPLFQVKAWLRRIEPQSPVIRPIEITISHTQEPVKIKPNDGEIETLAYLPDMQFGYWRDFETGKLVPFHDRIAIDVALQIIQLTNPDYLVLAGDTLDLPDWTDKFLRSPEFLFNTQTAIKEAAWWLAKLSLAAPNAKKAFLKGNHEERLTKSIIRNLPAAYLLSNSDNNENIWSVKNLLNLDRLGFEYIDNYPDGEYWIGKYLRCIHGSVARSGAMDTAKAIVSQSSVTTIFGHIHRREIASKTIVEHDITRVIHAASPGCLCKIDGSVPGSDKYKQWQNGIGIIYLKRDEPIETIELIPINNGTAIYQKQILVGMDRTPEIRDAIKKEFI